MDHRQAVDSKASERYLLGELTAEEVDDFERHYFECTECAVAVESGSVFIANAKAVFAEGAFAPSLGVRQNSPRKSFLAALAAVWNRPAVIAPSIASILFLGLVLYQDVIVIPGMRRSFDSPRALPVFQLSAASRGSETRVDVPNGTPSLALSADVPPDATFPEYRCELLLGSRTVFRVAVPSPIAGQPLTILVPTRELQSSQYVLRIYGIGPHGVTAKVADCLFDFQIQ